MKLVCEAFMDFRGESSMLLNQRFEQILLITGWNVKDHGSNMIDLGDNLNENVLVVVSHLNRIKNPRNIYWKLI